jgi:hypothetical protein
MEGDIRSEHTDLAVCDLARAARVLSRHATRRFALLQKPGLIDHQNRIVIRKVLDHILPHEVT